MRRIHIERLNLRLRGVRPPRARELAQMVGATLPRSLDRRLASDVRQSARLESVNVAPVELAPNTTPERSARAVSSRVADQVVRALVDRNRKGKG